MVGHETYLRLRALGDGSGERWIEGTATTARQDRVGDIVLPQGARYELPLPLLFAHNHSEPVGAVTEAHVSAAGIRVRAKLTRGVARADEVWQLVKDGALSLSVGFQPIRSTPMPNGGVRFDEWSWHELSCVSVPANPDARVQVAKCAAYSTASSAPRAGTIRVSRAADDVPPDPPTDLPAKPDAAWIKSVEPQRPGEMPMDVVIRRHEAALALLPEDARGLASFAHSRCDGRTVTLRDEALEVLATVDLRTKEVRIGTVPPRPMPSKARPTEAIGYVTHEDLAEFGAAAGNLISEIKASLLAEIKALQEDSLRYRGYWEMGMTAKRGEAYTHGGSLWRANRGTDHSPCNESPDWSVIARKGRDAK